MRRDPWRAAWLVTATAALTLIVQSAIAAPVRTRGIGFEGVRIVQDSEPTEIQGTAPEFVNVPGAAARVRVDEGQQRLIRARLTGEGNCLASVLCFVRLWSSGEATGDSPTGGEFIWYRTFQDQQPLPGSIERTIGPIPGPATVTVRLQVGFGPNGTAGSKFVLDDWHLSVESIYA